MKLYKDARDWRRDIIEREVSRRLSEQNWRELNDAERRMRENTAAYERERDRQYRETHSTLEYLEYCERKWRRDRVSVIVVIVLSMVAAGLAAFFIG